MKISNEVAQVLGNSRVEDNKLFLPDYLLERSLYVAVNKVLTSIGGKWNRKEKAHLFEECPENTIDSILITGEYTDWKKEFQFFETPLEIAERLVKLATIKVGESVLEPSAGRGAIAKLIPLCYCLELNKKNSEYLTDNGFNVVGDDFMEYTLHCDVIIANPPFTKQQDIDHVNHMMDLAQRRVVSIMSASVLWRDNKKAVMFRERVAAMGGIFEELSDNAFLSSGTKVKTCIVCIDLN